MTTNSAPDNMFDIPDEFDDALGNPLVEGAIRLPFFTPFIWATNGQKINKAIAKENPAMYFGGWTMRDDDMAQMAEYYNDGAVLPSWISQVMEGDGGEFTVFMKRQIYVALIGGRQRWEKNNPDDPNEKARSHYQALCFLAGRPKDEKGIAYFKPYGPVVLTVRGFQAQNLRQAFMDCEMRTRIARKQSMPNKPNGAHISMFYFNFGNFGDQPDFKLVGKTEGKQSTITPISLNLPTDVKEITVDLLKQSFVGRDIAEEVIDYRKRADEWLNAWKNDKAEVEKPEAIPQESEVNPVDRDFPPSED